ncbi:MAG: hypothetical protein JWN64_724 [Parcubacteria group bacterium]|nr:hypothetical protein [Parcubacteria group bacterium]
MAVLVVCLGVATVAQAKPTNAEINVCKNATLAQNHLTEMGARHLVAGTELIINGRNTPMVHHVWGTCEREILVATKATGINIPSATTPNQIVAQDAATSMLKAQLLAAQKEASDAKAKLALAQKEPANVKTQLADANKKIATINLWRIIESLILAALGALLLLVVFTRNRKPTRAATARTSLETDELKTQNAELQNSLADRERTIANKSSDLADAKTAAARVEADARKFREALSATRFEINLTPSLMTDGLGHAIPLRVEVLDGKFNPKNPSIFERFVRTAWMSRRQNFRLLTINVEAGTVEVDHDALRAELKSEAAKKWLNECNLKPRGNMNEWLAEVVAYVKKVEEPADAS